MNLNHGLRQLVVSSALVAAVIYGAEDPVSVEMQRQPPPLCLVRHPPEDQIRSAAENSALPLG